MKRKRKANSIRAAIVGYGGKFGIASHHLSGIRESGMTPVAVAEIDPERRESARKEQPELCIYASLPELLRKSDADLVTLITPHNTHARLAMQCLRSGRHVVTEKPFTITTDQADALVREARKRRLMVTAYHNRHWDGCIVEAVKHIRKRRAIGDVVRVRIRTGGYGCPGSTWRSSKKISGGILYDWGVHLIEYTLQLIDSRIVEVTGFANRGVWADQCVWGKDSNEDEAWAIVRFRNGAWLSLGMSHIESRINGREFEIAGTKGTYLMDHQTYEIIKRRGSRTVTTSGRNGPDNWSAFYSNVADHLAKGKELVITPEWARRPIHILDLANRSAKLGRTLKAKYG